MMALRLAVLAGVLVAARGHEKDEFCYRPGSCEVPPYVFSAVAATAPRAAWTSSGGYAAAASIQTVALTYGVWVSQSVVRLAADDGGGEGSAKRGWQVLHDNIGPALEELGFSYEYFGDEIVGGDDTGDAFVAWLKSKLSRTVPVVAFALLRGGAHYPVYPPPSNLMNATYDTAIPIFGLYSNASLAPPWADTVYADDVLVHGAPTLVPNGDANGGYARRFDSLVDTTAMGGNCSRASKGARAAAFPCFDRKRVFAAAVTGLAAGPSLPVALAVSAAAEPDTTQEGVKASMLRAKVTVGNLTAGTRYVIFRFDRGNAVVPNETRGYWDAADWCLGFRAVGASFLWRDPHVIVSNQTVAYRAIRDRRKGGDPGGSGLRALPGGP